MCLGHVNIEFARGQQIAWYIMIKVGQLENLTKEGQMCRTNRRVMTRRTDWYHLQVFSTIISCFIS